MSSYDLALLLHLLAGIGFLCGILVVRARVALIGVATALVLVSGLWLIEETGHSLGDGWLVLSLVLLAGGAALGGRGDPRADGLAAGLAASLRETRNDDP